MSQRLLYIDVRISTPSVRPRLRIVPETGGERPSRRPQRAERSARHESPRRRGTFEPQQGTVYFMAQRKVTLSLPGHTVAAAQAAARQAGAPFSTYVARALRNETLRQQLAASPLPEEREWMDMAEADETDGS
jgi:hypothetical protein